MRTIATNIYKYEELTAEAKEKARQWLSELITADEWSSSTYEDAANIGAKITGFDIDRGNFCYVYPQDGNNWEEIANNILKEHGEHCDTYKHAEAFTLKIKQLRESMTDDNEHDKQEDFEALEQELRGALQDEYLTMLRKDYDHFFSDEQIAELIKGNEYEFLEDGTHY